MKPATLHTLRRLNPWLDNPSSFSTEVQSHLSGKFLPRILRRAERWPVERKAHLLTGARQVGKSSFLWNRFATANEPPLFVSAEEPSLREWCLSPAEVVDDVRQLVPPNTPFFLDEAQHLGDAGLFVKGLIDGGLANPIYVTGSSAFHLKARTRESLAGRAVRAMLHPFSLEELCAEHHDLSPLLFADKSREIATRQMVVGGYPEAWLAEDSEAVLLDHVEAFLVRDASDLFAVENLTAFRNLLGLLTGQVGSLVNLSEWASLCGVSRNVVSSYLDILEDNHIITRIAPFVGGKRAEVTSRRKVYFCDNGILAAVGGGFHNFTTRVDRGRIMESWVATELLKHVFVLKPDEQLHFWRSKSGAEVDFVLRRGDRLFGFEVKAAHLGRPSLSRSARSFIEAYHPTRFYIINTGLDTRDHLGETEIHWVGPQLFARPNVLL